MDHIPWEFRSKKGTRTGKGNLNQDVCLQFSNTNISCFAVLDGHGRDGFQVAHFVADLLKEKLVERTKYTAFVLSDLAPLFKEIDLELCERGLKGGTTIACILFQHQTKTIVANAGDSHIVLIRNGKAHRLTATHNTTNDQERVRIESNGGEIRNNRVSGSHQVTRGFGDHHLKSYIISEPCVIEVDIGDLDRYLILGSDGVSNLIVIYKSDITNTTNIVLGWIKRPRSRRYSSEILAVLLAGSVNTAI